MPVLTYLPVLPELFGHCQQVGEDTLVGRHVVIATGACHADLGIAGEELLTTSTQFLDLDALPRGRGRASGRPVVQWR